MTALSMVEVERIDRNKISIHLRRINDVSAELSGYITRAGAIALAQALHAAAESDELTHEQGPCHPTGPRILLKQ